MQWYGALLIPFERIIYNSGLLQSIVVVDEANIYTE